MKTEPIVAGRRGRSPLPSGDARASVWRRARPERDTAGLNRFRYYQEKFDPTRSRPFAGESADFEVRSADGTRLAGTRLAGPPWQGSLTRPGGGALAIIVTHGLLANRRLPGLMALAESLARSGPVWTFDLRGHGESGGACTLGEAEAFDVGAVTAYVRATCPLPVVTVGFSMGAAAVVRAAALAEAPDAVVSVSGPDEWRGQRGWGARKTVLAWRAPGAVGMVRRVTGVRLTGWVPTGPSPLAVVGRIAPVPVLIVHGTDDPFFPPGEAEALYAGAGEPKDLWILEGGGHAEGLFCEPGRPTSQARVDAFADELLQRLTALLPAP